MVADLAVIKIFVLTAVSFLVAFLLTPLMTHFLYKFRFGKQIRKTQPNFYRLHKSKEGTPTMGGIIIWLTVLILALVILYLSKLLPLDIFRNLN